MFFYNLSIGAFNLAVRFAAAFHAKASAFVTGRKGIFQKLEAKFRDNSEPVVWVHCASLGEFEQGRPIIEMINAEFPEHRILLTFFSPSGYEVRRTYPKAFEVAYLPLDTPYNAKRFIDLTHPILAIFIKYEFWYHYSNELYKRGIPMLSVSSIFRKDQIFFKSYGSTARKTLKNFTYFFVQNSESKHLLKSLGIDNVMIAGDTRFDRVQQISEKAEEIPLARKFKGDQKVMIIGSCWEEDLDVLIPFINENKLKFIIAPHEISESTLSALEHSLEVKSIRYSKADVQNLEEFSVLIVDNVGMLSRLYRYGEFAYVGGAFGKGLHNILEPACFGIPVLFGNKNFEKFQEARDLINRGGAFEIRDYSDLKAKYEMLNVPESFMLACEVTLQYVEQNLGATEKIMSYCRPLLTQPRIESTVVR